MKFDASFSCIVLSVCALSQVSRPFTPNNEVGQLAPVEGKSRLPYAAMAHGRVN